MCKWVNAPVTNFKEVIVCLKNKQRFPKNSRQLLNLVPCKKTGNCPLIFAICQFSYELEVRQYPGFMSKCITMQIEVRSYLDLIWIRSYGYYRLFLIVKSPIYLAPRPTYLIQCCIGAFKFFTYLRCLLFAHFLPLRQIH